MLVTYQHRYAHDYYLADSHNERVRTRGGSPSGLVGRGNAFAWNVSLLEYYTVVSPPRSCPAAFLLVQYNTAVLPGPGGLHLPGDGPHEEEKVYVVIIWWL